MGGEQPVTNSVFYIHVIIRSRPLNLCEWNIMVLEGNKTLFVLFTVCSFCHCVLHGAFRLIYIELDVDINQ